MPSLGEAILFFKADKSDLDRGFRSAEQDAQGFVSRVGGVLSTGLKAAFATAAVGGAAAMGGIMKGIASNAQFEDFQTRFESIYGTIEGIQDPVASAKAHIQDLSTFAATTPFELPQVTKASQLLLTFGGVALDTEENLTRVGNAAAASGQSIDEVAFWYGRAYNAIQAGQPFGEAAMRLQEMGILGGDARLQIEALQQSGASSGEVWSAFADGLNAPNDAMEKLGKTWNGLMSTMGDTIDMSLRNATAPLFNILKPALESALGWLSSGETQAKISAFGTWMADTFGTIADTVIPAFTSAWATISDVVSVGIEVIQEIIGYARDWGSGIVEQLSVGIMGAAQPLVDALAWIGNTIAYWLQPNSPPKILPDLDRWGADAATVYMQGWTQGDFSAFNTLSGLIQSELESMVDVGAMSQDGVIPALFGSRAAIAEIIQSVRETGDASDELFAKLREASPAGQKAEDLARAFVSVEKASRAVADAQDDLARANEKVKQAQEELTAVTQKYNDELNPLRDQLDETERQLQAIEDAKRAASLQETINSGTATDEEKQIARLELQKLKLEQAIDAKERDQEAAENTAQANVDAAQQEQDAAQAKLDVAQEALDAEQSRMDALQASMNVQRENNSLVTEQVRLLEQLAAAQEKANKASAGGGKKAGGAGRGGGVAMPKINKPTSEIEKALADLNKSAEDSKTTINAGLNSISQTMTETQSRLAPIIAWFQQAFAPIAEAIGGAVSRIQQGFAEGGAIGAISTALGELGKISPIFELIRGVFDAAIQPISSIVQSVFGIIAGFIQTNGQSIVGFVQSAWTQIHTIIQMLLPPIQQVVGTVFGAIATFLQQHGGEIQNTLTLAWQTIQMVVQAALDFIQAYIVPILSAIAGFISEHSTQIQGILSGAWTMIQGIIQGALTIIQGIVNTVMSLLRGDWEGAWNGIKQVFEGIWIAIQGVLSGALTTLQNALTIAWDAVKVAFEIVWTGIKTTFETIWNGITTAVTTAVNTIQTTITTAWNTIKTTTETIFGTIGGAISTAFNSAVGGIKGIINGIIDGINVLIDGINAVSSAVGGSTLGHIPRLARGTNWFEGGLFVGGEKGMELARTPRGQLGLLTGGLYSAPTGTQVFDADKTAAMLGSSTTISAPISITIPVNGSVDQSVLQQLKHEVARAVNKALSDAVGNAGLKQANFR